MNQQCEGWTRHGGAFTIGPPRWERCRNESTWLLTATQNGETRHFPVCDECREEAKLRGITIVSEARLERNG
jgi:hypothetical protein